MAELFGSNASRDTLAKVNITAAASAAVALTI